MTASNSFRVINFCLNMLYKSMALLTLYLLDNRLSVLVSVRTSRLASNKSFAIFLGSKNEEANLLHHVSILLPVVILMSGKSIPVSPRRTCPNSCINENNRASIVSFIFTTITLGISSVRAKALASSIGIENWKISMFISSK